MLERCFQRLFGATRHAEFTFQQIGGGTVCNLRFFTVPTTCSRPSTKMSAFFFFTVPTTCSRPSTKMSAFSFWFFYCADYL